MNVAYTRFAILALLAGLTILTPWLFPKTILGIFTALWLIGNDWKAQ